MYNRDMPGKNIVKDYLDESYYHIYNRGVAKGAVFKDDRDYIVFLSLFKRYLGGNKEIRQNRGEYPNYSKDIELLAFSLMPNHFHLFIYQHKSEAMTDFMRSLSVSYSMYFNKRHKRVGPVFQQRYKAVRITDDSQLLHITRYIHLNADNYKIYEWSSYPYYLGKKQADWLRPNRAIELFKDIDDYASFVDDYKDRHDELEELKSELADAD